MDSSAVYKLFEELTQKIEELNKSATPENQTDLTFDINEIISIIEELKVLINCRKHMVMPGKKVFIHQLVIIAKF